MNETVIATAFANRDVLYDETLASRSLVEQQELIADARALIVRNRMQVTSDLLDSARSLEVIGRLGVGMDNIDVAACEKRNIVVCPATDANSLSVSEYVIMAALTLLRCSWNFGPEVLDGAWPRKAAACGREIAGKRIGFVGFGAIPRLTAPKVRALGMTVAAFDPFLSQNCEAWQGATRLELVDLLETSDVISLHVPITESTRGMIDRSAIARTKPGAVIINSSRGDVIDEDALVDALRNGRLAGAALDVFQTEPLDRKTAQKFDGISNLLLTPHVAGITVESSIRISSLTAENVLRVLDS